MSKSDDLYYMKLALEQAKKGQWKTSPNPCVGAVIVNNDEIVGMGYHRKAGAPHAEVNAINDAGELSKNSTIYVTLEPCNHSGKTPPCTQAIINSGLRRVVIGMSDPNPSVAGGGAKYLSEKGVEVISGILEEECIQINRPFIKYITSGIPWIIMKAGMSLDGKINYQKGSGGQITGKQSKQYVHALRDQCDAILIGVETAIIDNPSLTTRLERKPGSDPHRVILDTSLRLSPEAFLLQQQSDASTYIFCGKDVSKKRVEALCRKSAVVKQVTLNSEGKLDLKEILYVLGQEHITSVLVEGGAKIHGAMLAENLVDEVCLLIAPIFIGNQGCSVIDNFAVLAKENAPKVNNLTFQQLGEDIVVSGLLHSGTVV